MFGRGNQTFLGNWWWQIDKVGFLLIFLLLISGMIFVTSGSFSVARKIDLHQNYFIVKHIYYVIAALFIMCAISMMDEEFFKQYSLYIFCFFYFLVILTFFFGTQIKGSRRWLYIFGFSLQPSEFLKVMFIPISALILCMLEQISVIKVYIVSSLLCFLTIGLLILQPDIGMAMLIFSSWAVQIFISGIPMILIFIPLIVFVAGIVLAYIFFEHVHLRIDSFIHSISGEAQLYQIKQSANAFYKGGFFGVGPGQGKVKIHLPDSHTDFIYSVIGEEFGTITCIMIIVVYILISLRFINKSSNERNLFRILTTVGLSIQFIFQAFINIGVNIRLLPAKGMTLPFISYGGSSMIASALLIGIIMLLNKRQYGYLRGFNT